ncbi:MAG: sensor domain-containing diguanylate cyclase [Candidatus Omnitrophota bacterium]
MENNLDRSKAGLIVLYEISCAMRTTLKLEHILYIILTGVTSHEGLGFNRAMLFLVNEDENLLEGKMGIGPDTGEDAKNIWQQIEADKMTLEDLITAYDRLKAQTDPQLNNLVKSIKIPLNESSGILALTALEGMPFEISEDISKEKVDDATLRMLQVTEFVTVPLKAKDKVIGVILADNLYTKQPIAKEDVKLLTMFANQAGLAIENSRLYEQTVFLSNVDSLTGLFNHGYFQTTLSKKLKEAESENKPLSLIMCDIDFFKNFNDSLGHQSGDKVLARVAYLIKHSLRETDIATRYGGEEFAVILPDTDTEEAYRLAERIRNTVEKHNIINPDNPSIKAPTISAGIASFPKDARMKEELIKAADSALYKAKEFGRNKIICFSSQ